MAETILSPDIKPESPEQFELVDDMTQAHIPSMARGVVQRASFGDPRWRVKRRYRVRTSDKAKLMALLQNAQGRYATVRATPGFVQRGSFPATELFTNNDFSNGTTGWTITGGNTLSVSDRVARVKTAVSGEIDIYQNVSLTQYAPHVLRFAFQTGRGLASAYAGPFLEGAALAANYSTSRGLISVSGTPYSGSSQSQGLVAPLAGYQNVAGDFHEVYYSSLARCFLIDNRPNALTYSDQFDNAAWTKSALTVTADYSGTVAPDGTTNADYIAEDSSTGAHYIVQSGPTVSATADYVGGVMLRQQNMDRDIQVVVGTTGSGHYGACTFDLSAGTAGAASIGGSATNARAFIVNMGNSWYACYVVVRLPTSATRADLQLNMISAGSSSYTGGSGGTTGIVMVWRGGVAQSSLPVRFGQVTSAAAASGTSQTGSGLYVKGGPVSTSGSLLSGDFSEIGGELKQLTASLDFDAAGLGYMQFRPGLFRSPADNDPVIVNNPMGRFTVSDIRWDNLYGLYNDLSLTLDEVYE